MPTPRDASVVTCSGRPSRTRRRSCVALDEPDLRVADVGLLLQPGERGAEGGVGGHLATLRTDPPPLFAQYTLFASTAMADGF